MERPEIKKDNKVIEKIPDKLLKPIQEAQGTKGQLTQQCFQIALQRANIENKYRDSFAKLASTGTSIGNKIKRAFDKMKLGKKKNFNWRFDGKDSFMGVPKPEPKKKEEKK